MKTRIIYSISVFLVLLLLNSCSVDKFEVQGQLTEETFVQNEASARSVLNGIYDGTRPNGDMGIFYSVLGAMTAGVEQEAAAGSPYEAFYKNNVKAEGVESQGGFFIFYKRSYGAINLANLFIKTIEEKGIKGVSEETQKELVAEAKILRAHTYFRLLRIFGQFYDSSSEYGVITTANVIDGFTYLKRAKVSETYNQIITDLEFALQYASDSRERIYVGKTFAKALLAKVYLYKGGTDNWMKTATHCKEIIDQLGSKFQLVEKYNDIFEKGYKSPEVIYAPFYNKKESVLGGFPMNTLSVKPTSYLTNLAENDPRFAFTYSPQNRDGVYHKYTFENATFYYLRVSEVYLMYAEAIARADGDMQEALEALNAVRKRAFSSVSDDSDDDDDDSDDDSDDDGLDGFKPSKSSIKSSDTYTFVDKATLLEDIRKEKMLELQIENGESWFDLVRYDRLGDIDATTLKESIKSPNQFIFPIPLRAIRNNPNFGPQNPGY